MHNALLMISLQQWVCIKMENNFVTLEPDLHHNWPWFRVKALKCLNNRDSLSSTHRFLSSHHHQAASLPRSWPATPAAGQPQSSLPEAQPWTCLVRTASSAGIPPSQSEQCRRENESPPAQCKADRFPSPCCRSKWDTHPQPPSFDAS